ncbi:PH domain-containing protein [Streptomyces cyslabdanicus]|uniref:PH domain-containing protein n=1 Tax=Streptomyces cyslabdanicus TaxID=1470456 RepID=UPI004043D27E
MVNVSRHLADDEELVHATRQQWTQIVGAFVVLVVVWAVATALLWVSPSDKDWGTVARYVVLGLAVVASLWFWLLPLMIWRSTVYIVTTKRISVRKGFLTKTGHSIPLTRVNDVEFNATLWQRILRGGTLTIQSGSEHGTLELKHVPDPEGLQSLIYSAVEEEQQHHQWGGAVPPATG